MAHHVHEHIEIHIVLVFVWMIVLTYMFWPVMYTIGFEFLREIYRLWYCLELGRFKKRWIGFMFIGIGGMKGVRLMLMIVKV